MFCGFQDWVKVHPGATAKELAKAIDRSEAAVSKTLSLSRCIKVVQEAAEAGQIGVNDWHAISQGDDSQQAEMLMARLQGAAPADLKRVRTTSTGVRTARVKCLMGSGVSVTLVGVGQGLTLEDVEETLAALLKEVRKGKEQGLDSKTFTAVLRDKAKAG